MMLGAVPAEFEAVLAQPFKRNMNAARRSKKDALERLIKTSGNWGQKRLANSKKQERWKARN